MVKRGIIFREHECRVPVDDACQSEVERLKREVSRLTSLVCKLQAERGGSGVLNMSTTTVTYYTIA